MNAMADCTAQMFEALRRIGCGSITAKDIGVNANTLNALCDKGLLHAERTPSITYYEPTPMGLGAIAVLNAPFVPKGLDGPITRIQTTVANYYGIPLAEMTSQRRHRGVARPRQVAMYLARELTPLSLPSIGKRFGDRDHTTVLHAIRTIGYMDENDPKMSADINALLAELEALRA